MILIPKANSIVTGDIQVFREVDGDTSLDIVDRRIVVDMDRRFSITTCAFGSSYERGIYDPDC